MIECQESDRLVFDEKFIREKSIKNVKIATIVPSMVIYLCSLTIKDSSYKKNFPNPPTYYSDNYFRARVLSVMLHKDGIPPNIRETLKIK